MVHGVLTGDSRCADLSITHRFFSTRAISLALDLAALGIAKIHGKLFTVTNYRDSVYGEDVRKIEKMYFREWEPKRSKIAAAILKKLKDLPFKRDSHVLYLGASTGTTVSHLSDICSEGRIYAVEKAYDPFVKLLSLSERRDNIYPILEDAGVPERYSFFIDRVDTIYQDIAQRNQVQIFNQNARKFSGVREAMLVLKVRSISGKGSEDSILRQEIRKIDGFRAVETVNLSPYSKANYLIRLQRQ